MSNKKKDKYKFTVKTKITPEIYRNFARFDTFMLKKRWILPLFVFANLMALAGIFFMSRMNLLAVAAVVIGIAFPIIYFNTFNRIMNDNTRNAPYGAVIDDYLVSLTDEGIEVYSEEEQAECTWRELHAAYLLSDCIVLYLTKEKSFLISEFNEKRFPQIWEYICECAGNKAKDRRSAIS